MRKILSVVLAMAMLLGMCFSASAVVINGGLGGSLVSPPNPGSIRGINEQNYNSLMQKNAESGYISLNDSQTFSSLSDLANLEVYSGDVIKIHLTGNLFLNSSGNVWANQGHSVSKSQLSSADIKVRTSNTAGEGAATITLEGNKSGSYIKIEFSKNPAYAGKKFAYSVYLGYRGSRKNATRISVKGLLEPKEIEVDRYDDYVDISDGSTIKALANVTGIELYLGEDCSIVRNLTRGRTYSGVAITDILPKDERLFSSYPSLEYIYRLETVGLKTTGNIVRFDLDGTYYAYNSNGTYLGTTNKALPYWTTYYLTAEKYQQINVVR